MKTRITIGEQRYVPQPGDFFTWSTEPYIVCLAIQIDEPVVGAAEGSHKLTNDRVPHIELRARPRLQKFSRAQLPNHEFTKMKLVAFEGGELIFERA
jgi:hypothetical protein